MMQQSFSQANTLSSSASTQSNLLSESYSLTTLHHPARVIQRAYRAHLDRRVFAHYRRLMQLIAHSTGAGSSSLVKAARASDAGAVSVLSHLHGHAASAAPLDSAARQHVRFRLGGQWPPTVYWRVATRMNVVDLGSFAPRDYAAEAMRRTLNVKRQKGHQDE